MNRTHGENNKIYIIIPMLLQYQQCLIVKSTTGVTYQIASFI